MKLLFEKSLPGSCGRYLPDSDVPEYALPEDALRKTPPALPELSETELSRHYSALSRRTYGVNCGFYPLGSCTMKYNPRINEELAALPGFTEVHPLQPEHTVSGCRAVLDLAEDALCRVTGMDAMSFQPAAGAHGEFTGLLLIRAYHRARGDFKRMKILVPDSAHGTNPASAAMAGFDVVNLPSREDGLVDLDALRRAAGEDTAGLMLTNPNTLGLFDTGIREIADIVHEAGGLLYYDGANLNAVLGVARPGDMGFDVVHLNLHKTFSTPHGGGGPGSGPVGCKEALRPYLPASRLAGAVSPESIGQVRAFHGNFLVVVRALAYLLSLGSDGLLEASETAVLNANYLLHRLSPKYKAAYSGRCMHEFVLTLEDLKSETGVSALDLAKALADRGIHPPTMYFPLIVHEALMLEPTETETKETLDEAADLFLELYKAAHDRPELLKNAPLNTPVRRPDEVAAARNPVLRYTPGEAAQE
ncbi:aminomethyl-transferring glycine dehydrogenase subunit GcvPB [Papillibacter cinnamivorans]|uniref:Probable glycine dehydrogenase (decarboxylating) subunit 2 n=1 Tax=Papillibacter cinnamivorans DSM 12816 TaxID=1122930 RepID=A0A1W1ZME5_9FIRM|nr:aminomethyl-transferring glycine dehydrogenase subunit GcvPB [Papillibacter cinnamivorans]SMC49715.1 glycine dehydrogenase subunit 2 [Papillibacter cinnamivorans DSM 12816]